MTTGTRYQIPNPPPRQSAYAFRVYSLPRIKDEMFLKTGSGVLKIATGRPGL